MAKNDQAKSDSDAAVQAPKADETAGLVKMRKDAEELLMHPSTVEAHRKQGWKVIE